MQENMYAVHVMYVCVWVGVWVSVWVCVCVCVCVCVAHILVGKAFSKIHCQPQSPMAKHFCKKITYMTLQMYNYVIH